MQFNTINKVGVFQSSIISKALQIYSPLPPPCDFLNFTQSKTWSPLIRLQPPCQLVIYHTHAASAETPFGGDEVFPPFRRVRPTHPLFDATAPVNTQPDIWEACCHAPAQPTSLQALTSPTSSHESQRRHVVVSESDTTPSLVAVNHMDSALMQTRLARRLTRLQHLTPHCAHISLCVWAGATS